MQNTSDQNIRYTAAVFDKAEDLIGAAAEARQEGFEIHDAFTPYPVHGLDWAVGLQRSRLTWIAFFAGLLGLSSGLLLQWWTSVYSWPLIIGGKPFNSFPLFIPVAFELTVLFSGLIAIGVLFLRNRLWLTSKKKTFDRVTDDSFVLVLQQSDGSFDMGRAMRVFDRYKAVEVLDGEEFV